MSHVANNLAAPAIALVDCDNFFVSCERLFRPDLEGRPVVVLSSNDGCVVSRSQEAKAIGIPMGAPAFRYRELFIRQRVVQFSANFELYGDVSRRIVRILTEHTPRLEVYSIDESFLDLGELGNNICKTTYVRQLRQRLLGEVGIPVSIGVATTKTLAKLSAAVAKRTTNLQGVLDTTTCSKDAINNWRRKLPVEEVWGVGRRYGPLLRSQGLATAQDMATMRPRLARKLMGVRGEQTSRELSGQPCLRLQPTDSLPKSIMRTRTFGQDTSSLDVLVAALARFASVATHRLRASGQLATTAGWFTTSSPHKPGYGYWQHKVKLTVPTADPAIVLDLIRPSIFGQHNSGRIYHRAGFWLADFVPSRSLQTDLFGQLDPAIVDSRRLRWQAIDMLNNRYGRHTIRLAAEDLATTWQPSPRCRSPAYTTNWSDIPIAAFQAF